MRAAVFKGAGPAPMVIEHLPDPEPLDGEVVIKVCRCGICGTDVHMTSGHGNDVPVGSVPGHEFAGEVIAIGKGAEGFKVGDRIAAMPARGCGHCVACLSGFPMGCFQMQGMVGGFGEYMRVHTSSAIHLPKTLSMADGALVEPLAVGLRGVVLANVPVGGRVLVVGAGSVGLAAIYWARMLGAGKIAAASPSARRAELAMQMGADAFETLGEGEGERINAKLGGMPDVVLECTGAVGTLQKAVELVAPGGTISSLGFCTKPDPVLPSLATWKQLTIKFSFTYNMREFQHCADVMGRGYVEPRMMISETVPLGAFPAMLEAIRNGASQTKVHVDPWAAA